MVEERPKTSGPRPADGGTQLRFRVTGMDCPSCAAKVERAVRATGVQTVRVSIATQILTLYLDDPGTSIPRIRAAVTELGYEITCLSSGDGSTGEEEEPDSESRPLSPAYRRALATVVLLNIGYGVVEMFGGFLSTSQALKADALDFLGDGLITWLGLLAIGWSLLWRARSALLQGIFLGALGLGVLATTLYRMLAQRQPEPELMGIFGLAALAINLAAAGVLVPHRTGDANVRAVWLFSRNDAIGNVAVVLAAGLVAWTGTPWPDLVVALAIAGLFLQSARSIIGDARRELGNRRSGPASR